MPLKGAGGGGAESPLGPANKNLLLEIFMLAFQLLDLLTEPAGGEGMGLTGDQLRRLH